MRRGHFGGARGLTITVIPDQRVDPALGIEALYREHRSAVYRFLLRELGDPCDAEDATQTVFASALRAIGRGRTPRSPRPWLFAIARNAARRTWRERSRRAVADVDPDTLPGSPATDVDRQELLGALDAIPDAQRRALLLHELGGLEYAEIAAETGQSVAGVETAIFRARRACRAQLRADGTFTHEAAAKLIGRLVAGKLTRTERISVEAHIRDCVACADEERSLRSSRSSRARRLLGWLLSLPEGLHRLAALFQAPSPRAFAALVVAGAAVVGGGGETPTPAPGAAPVLAAPLGAREVRPAPLAARPEPVRHAVARAAPAPPSRARPAPVRPAAPRARSRPVVRSSPPAPAGAPVALPAPRPEVPTRPGRAVESTRQAEPASPAPRSAAVPTPPREAPATRAVVETVTTVVATAGGLTDPLAAGVESLTDQATTAVRTVTDTAPVLPLPPSLAAPVVAVGDSAADTLSAAELPRLGEVGAP